MLKLRCTEISVVTVSHWPRSVGFGSVLRKTAVSIGFGFLTTTKNSCGRLMITRTPSTKCKLHGWSSDGTLLMRREGGSGGTSADTLLLQFHACQFAVVCGRTI